MKKIIKYLPISLIFLFITLLINRVTDIFVTTSGSLYGNKIPNFSSRVVPELQAHPFAFSFRPEALFTSGLFLAMIVLIIASKDTRIYRRGEEYGSNKEGKISDLKPFAAPKKVSANQNIILGWGAYLWIKNDYKDFQYFRAKNVFNVGGTGATKTTNFNIPNILQMYTSYVCTDPKLEEYHKTALVMEENGYKVKVLNLINFQNSDQFNPWVYVKTEESLQDMINLIIKSTDGENARRSEPFWDNSEKLLLSALFSYLYYNYRGYERVKGEIIQGSGELPSLADIGELIRNIERKDPDVPSPVEILFEDFEAKFGSDCPAVLDFHSFKNYKGETRASVVSMPTARFRMFTLPRLREMTSRDTLELDKMGEQKMILYVGLNDLSDTYHFLSNMVFTLMFQTIEDISDHVYGGPLPIPIQFVFEEFPSIGAIPNILKAIAVLRGRGANFLFTAQNFDQLKRVYKETWDEILGACDSIVYMSGATTELTAEKIAKKSGKQTIGKKSEGRSFGGQQSGSQNTDGLQRDVYMPDEVEMLGRKDALVKISGVPIVKVRKYKLHKHPKAKYLAKNVKDPRWYNAERYITDGQEIEANIAKEPEEYLSFSLNLSDVA